MTIEVGATSNVFKRGHRIRLEVSSSNFPRFDRNSNMGGIIAEDAQLLRADQTVFHDARRPSRLFHRSCRPESRRCVCRGAIQASAGRSSSGLRISPNCRLRPSAQVGQVSPEVGCPALSLTTCREHFVMLRK
jgi:hypothetical protein